MYLGTLESDFARSIGILIAIGVILFALQGILLPQASFYGQVLFGGLDLLQVMQYIGLVTGITTLVAILADIKLLQRLSFAFIAWFYMTFAFVLVWLVGLQAPSVTFALVTVLMAGAVYGYLTQRGKKNENINRRSYRKNTIRESVSRDYTSTRVDERSID